MRKWTDRSQLLNLCVQPWLCHITVRIIKSCELYVQYLDRPDSLLFVYSFHSCTDIFLQVQVIYTWMRDVCNSVLCSGLTLVSVYFAAFAAGRVFRRSCFLLPVSLHGKLVSICAFQVVMCFSVLSSILFLHFILFFLVCIHPSCKKSNPVILSLFACSYSLRNRAEWERLVL